MSQTRHVLLDIEGTVAPISFVYDVLFPYARDHLTSFLTAHWSDEAVQQDVVAFRALAETDINTGMTDVVEIPSDEAGSQAVREAVMANVRNQMDADRKTTPLKSLQGKIWQAGFLGGELKSVLYPDVKPALERWRTAGLGISIYSSGSIHAQRLFFGHTEHGDLTDFFDGYYDTTTGPKRDAASYGSIAAHLGVPPESILFATDVVEEAQAAREAGYHSIILDRPGNHPQPAHDFQVVPHFEDI